jgi:hypothetical protein
MKVVDAGPGLKNRLGVNIDLNGFPRGSPRRHLQDTERLNCGRPMVPASETS